MSQDAAHLLDFLDLARVLRLRSRDGAGWSAEAARALVKRHPELQAKALYITPKCPRWRHADVMLWVETRNAG